MATDLELARQPEVTPSEFKEGIFYDMSFEEYAAIPALNGSSLVHLRRSPMKFKHEFDNPTPPTNAMLLGVATHRLILEPNRVGDFAVWGLLKEEKVRRGEVWENFKKLNEGAMIVTQKERDVMVGVAVAVKRSAPAREYIKAPGKTEVSMFWVDKQTGLNMKGRVDKLLDKGHVIVDLKTTRDCQPWKFGAQASTLGYHVKFAMYASGYKQLTGHEPKMKFIAVESKAPHECAVYHAPTDFMVQGQIDLQGLLIKLMECHESDSWPPQLEEEIDLTLPAYAYADADELADLVYE